MLEHFPSRRYLDNLHLSSSSGMRHPLGRVLMTIHKCVINLNIAYQVKREFLNPDLLVRTCHPVQSKQHALRDQQHSQSHSRHSCSPPQPTNQQASFHTIGSKTHRFNSIILADVNADCPLATHMSAASFFGFQYLIGYNVGRDPVSQDAELQIPVLGHDCCCRISNGCHFSQTYKSAGNTYLWASRC